MAGRVIHFDCAAGRYGPKLVYSSQNSNYHKYVSSSPVKLLEIDVSAAPDNSDICSTTHCRVASLELSSDEQIMELNSMAATYAEGGVQIWTTYVFPRDPNNVGAWTCGTKSGSTIKSANYRRRTNGGEKKGFIADMETLHSPIIVWAVAALSEAAPVKHVWQLPSPKLVGYQNYNVGEISAPLLLRADGVICATGHRYTANCGKVPHPVPPPPPGQPPIDSPSSYMSSAQGHTRRGRHMQTNGM